MLNFIFIIYLFLQSLTNKIHYENKALICLYISSSLIETKFATIIFQMFSIVLPQIAHFDFGEESMNEGDTVSLQCTITKGDIPVDINWFLNGKSIENRNEIFVTKLGKRVSSLRIDAISAEHSGEYTCRATNMAGSVNYTTNLAVNGTNFKENFV